MKYIKKIAVMYYAILSVILYVKNYLLNTNVKIIGVYRFRKSKLIMNGFENLISNKSIVYKTRISLKGEGNSLLIENGRLNNCMISISGKKNKVVIEDNSLISNLIIHVRGENNIILIKKGTSIGGARIVNVGKQKLITIGQDCMLSDNIEIWSSDTHPIFDINTKKIINNSKDIIIEDKVWVGAHVKILKGVFIGSNSIIGMGTIVTEKVPSNVVFGGYPGRILKHNVTWDKEFENNSCY